MKLFSLPARTGRLPTTDDEGTDESKMEAPASPTTATLPEDLTTIQLHQGSSPLTPSARHQRPP